MDALFAMLRENSFFFLAAGACAGIMVILHAFGLLGHWYLAWCGGDHGAQGSGGTDGGDCGGGD
ncbi:MAG: hypothetical protein HLUCCO17_10425 [Saliniramus fredricksonii]|jgi:hypothetical protein|uniref:Uncharacterized protein n=1 Tax=Saliniramus fredricksonii TaxID=1653334 RepID=A0A0P8BLZ9_9HYPH|nr:hypothetical protein [Saliniramus fredricksonii]KPQ10651.1 MAG: hypothetical protein HLUCCO17_10425 [Saliniramus fredricksonii]SCC79377.1 hypothetical protein GA0071312_0840 [Saliniramus fredricksonii]